MKTLKWILAGLIVGVVAVAFRDMNRGVWLSPALPRDAEEPDGEEPVLGYDGMDQETLLDWIDSSDLDARIVEQMIRYEEANQGREPILEALSELLD
jgi:hypothetical protein